MGTSQKGQRTQGTAQEKAGSQARLQGRRLTLKFTGPEVPILTLASFLPKAGDDANEWNQADPATRVDWSELPKVFSLFCLQYVAWSKAGKPDVFYFQGRHKGSLAATLGDAIHGSGQLPGLFSEIDAAGKSQPRIKLVFPRGQNIHGRDKDKKDRRITVSQHYLPADCVEIFWDARGDLPLTEPADLALLEKRLRESSGLPAEPAPSSGEASPPLKTTAPAPTQPKEPEQEMPPRRPSAPPAKEPTTAFGMLEAQKAAGESAKSAASVGAQSKPGEPEHVPPPKPPPVNIDKRLFEIQHPAGGSWDDSDGLLNFGDDEDIWRVKDASEGVLIFGAVGSGKTSGSGSAFANAFLQAGYGGLVLTAKPDEAKRWLRLCEKNGRAQDCVHVTPGSGHKLNILQYEAQRPGERLTVTDDLIALMRCLIGVMSRSKRHGVADDFWSNSTNQLIRMAFEVFLLSGESLSMDSIIRFVNIAPTDQKKPWQDIPYFSDLIARAGAFARNGTGEDQRIYAKAYEYWTGVFPKIADATRSGIVIGLTAMAEVLGGRGIYELIATTTNLTPEMILSGKIVILDFPLKESVQGGLMVQAAWKLLFQQAIERRTDKGLKTARPVFLWEDEGHLFFSQHDVDFQPTARDCRAAHVILSQNIHNFLHQGHDPHAIYAVFSAINTNIFHTNGDMETNTWASSRIGTEAKRKIQVNVTTNVQRPGLFTPPPKSDYESKASISHNQEAAFRPEAFSSLKKGGDGTCEAVLLWLSHNFKHNKGRPFCVIPFDQEQRQE